MILKKIIIIIPLWNTLASPRPRPQLRPQPHTLEEARLGPPMAVEIIRNSLRRRRRRVCRRVYLKPRAGPMDTPGDSQPWRRRGQRDCQAAHNPEPDEGMYVCMCVFMYVCTQLLLPSPTYSYSTRSVWVALMLFDLSSLISSSHTFQPLKCPLSQLDNFTHLYLLWYFKSDFHSYLV